MKNLSYFFALILIGFACQKPLKEPVFPKDEWLSALPEEVGLNADKLQKAVNFLASKMHHDGIGQLLIIKDGYVIFDGGKTDSVHNIYSCSKTFTSTVLGVMIDDGLLSLDDSAARHEPLLDSLYSSVTYRHFTTMTSGYSAVGDSRWPDANYSDWSWTVYAPEEPLFAPGSAYAYWDEAQMMFGRALTQVLQRPMHSYLTEKVTDEIGMKWTWGTEKELENGVIINNGCTGVTLDAYNFARWGLLFLNEGSWNGVQLLNPKYVKMATSVQVPASLPVGDTDRSDVIGPGCYGFNWWVNGVKADGKRKLPGAPDKTYFASGFNNNKCFVIPEWKIVLIRMGEDGNIKDADKEYSEFIRLLGASINS